MAFEDFVDACIKLKRTADMMKGKDTDMNGYITDRGLAIPQTGIFAKILKLTYNYMYLHIYSGTIYVYLRLQHKLAIAQDAKAIGNLIVCWPLPSNDINT